MPLAAGFRIGPYEITAPLGAGGMGEVYRATDTNLGRAVAIKVLPEAFAQDAERLARFEREARVLASLNHPHIAAVHGVETSGNVRALVMELVEGPTLADRLAGGPLALDEALALARQIADGVEAAHEQGIVHRDLKPGNIKVRPDGVVKILDFGLAKVQAPGHAAADATQAPTITTPALMTGIGVILGTAAYMSPEQAKGREADARSDIWAFGAVLYEMLTGRRPFEGEDVSDTLASVLKSDPDWTRLPADVPRSLRGLMRRCLAKDRKQRPSGMSAIAFVLSEQDDPDAAEARPAIGPSGPVRRWPLVVAAGAVSAAIAAGLAWTLRPGPSPSPAQIARFSFTLPAGQAFLAGGTRQLVAISPDGTRLAYVANSRLYLRDLAETEPREIQGTASQGGVAGPTFSPDGNSIAYVDLGGGGLKRIAIAGGSAQTIAQTAGFTCGSSWAADGILFAARVRGGQEGIWRVQASSGSPELLIESKAGEQMCAPQLLPDGDTLLFTLANDTGDDRWDKARIVAQSIDSRTRTVLLEGGSDGRYLTSGHLLYAVAGTMYAVPMDVRRLALNGRGVPVLEGVRRSTGQVTGATHLALSDTGALVYLPGPASTAATMYRLTVSDTRGGSSLLNLPPAAYDGPRVSPDGRMVAVTRSDGRDADIWTYDLSGETQPRRLTFGGNNRFPVWSHDGRRVTFQSSRDRDQAIWWQPVEGGAVEKLTRPASGEEHVPESWSLDGRHLLFTNAKAPTWPPAADPCSCTLWVRASGDGSTARFGEAASGNPFNATFSPDGRWVAYSIAIGVPDSPDRGVFVEAFPSDGTRRQAPRTTGRDFHPVWARDKTPRLFYVGESSQPVVAVSIATRPVFAFGPSTELGGPQPGLQSWRSRGYDVLPDGRFVSLQIDTGSGEVRVVLNWLEELRRRVRAN